MYETLLDFSYKLFIVIFLYRKLSDSIPKNAELDTESICDMAKIYTKSNLNDYQKRNNSASADLCINNPALLLNWSKRRSIYIGPRKGASRWLPIQEREKPIKALFYD
jgi:hypothetical protein